jgi:hypothetical protein
MLLLLLLLQHHAVVFSFFSDLSTDRSTVEPATQWTTVDGLLN